MNLTYDQKLEILKRAIERGEEDIKAGRVRTLAEVIEMIREKIKKAKKSKKGN